MEEIVVGVDGSPQARRALAWAIEEARTRTARVVAVYAYEPYVPLAIYPYGGASVPQDMVEEARAGAEQMLVKALEGMDADVEIVSEVVGEVQPAAALLDRAKDADLLVVGSRGRGGFAGLLLGSVSQQCAQHAPCPVVVVPGHDLPA